MTRKISAGVVVTVNDGMDVWRPGHVLVEGNRIVGAGPGNGPDSDFEEVVAEPNGILMPGLVNGHAHSPSNLVKGTWSRLPLEIWRQHIRAAWREYSDEAIHVSAQLGLVEMIRTGVTAVLDHFYSGSTSPHMGALNAVAAMEEAGVRGGLALTLSDEDYARTVGVEVAAASPEAREEMQRISQFETAESFEGFLEFAAALKGNAGLVVPIVGPSAPHRCSKELLERCSRAAEELDTTVHIHVAETKSQFLQSLKAFGTSAVGRLDAVGVLNERLSMAHCVWLTEDDIQRVADRGAVVIHNPASNGKLGSGRMRLDDMLRAGVRVGIATDGSGSNDTQNVFEAMRLAGIVHNRNEQDYRDWPEPAAILKAATRGSAYALGLGGKIGTIELGRLADLVLLSADTYHFTPLNDVINQLVYCENGVSVRSVMIDGRWVLRNGKLLTIDETRLYERARALRSEMDQRLQQQYARTTALEPSLREAWLRAASTPWSDRDGIIVESDS